MISTWRPLHGAARLSKNRRPARPSITASSAGPELTRFLEDGRLCMSNNAVERELPAVSVGRRNWTFAGLMEAVVGQRPFTRSLPLPSRRISIRKLGSCGGRRP